MQAIPFSYINRPYFNLAKASLIRRKASTKFSSEVA